MSIKSYEKLKCIVTGEEFSDDGLLLENPNSEKPGFLRPQFFKKDLNPLDSSEGLYRFIDWLPIFRKLKGSSAPVTYKSEGLAKELGLSNLYITFNGYWPEKGVNMMTGTFKECEAYSVCARMPLDTGEVLVVASAGNTARAFSRVCSENNIPLLVVVPEAYLYNMWFEEKLNPCVKLIAAGGNSDYFDAIRLAGLTTQIDGFFPEGGAKNVARRSGMGTTVLSAVTTIGEIPDYYFQAVGSGTGAIAAWEANLLFNQSGKYGVKKMKLCVAQNEPFIPMYDSYKADSREFLIADEETAIKQVEAVYGTVLTNRKPPWGLVGGLYDALKDSGGEVLTATNDEAKAAQKLFLELEGNDISPAAAVAAATLISAVKAGTVNKDGIIMLNITGGGIERLKREKHPVLAEPAAVIDKADFELSKVKSVIEKLF